MKTAVLLALTLASTAEARPPARQIGPFALGMTVQAFRAAAQRLDMTSPRAGGPQERDVMGLGMMTVQPISTEARDAAPVAGKIWAVEALLLSGRVVMLTVDYGQEDPERARRTYHDHDVSPDVRKHLTDTTWTAEGVVLHADRFGRAIHAVDWIGLRKSDRALVDLDGAVRVANEYFRRVRAREAEASLDLIRERVIAHFARPSGAGRACTAPESVELTPAETACELPEKRFPEAHEAWSAPTWRALGLSGKEVSRWYSYSIESSGELGSTRVVLIARGDQDCNSEVATLRVTLRARPDSTREDCGLDRGEWDVINPYE